MDSITMFYRDPWISWREIPVFERDQMWKHFRTKCTWYPQHEYQTFCNFEIKAASLLDDTMRTAWEKDQKPDWMNKDMWSILKWEKFETPYIQEMEKKKGRALTYDEVFGYKKGLDEGRQSQATSEDDSSNQSSDDDEASILPEAIGGVKNGKAHGLGSRHCLGCQEEIHSLRRQVQTLLKKQKRDSLRFARLENLVQNLIDICRSDESDCDSDGEN